MGFYSTTKGGLMTECKECTKARTRRNRLVNLGHYQEYERKRANLPHRLAARNAYAKTEAGRIAGNRAKRHYLDRNPVKRAANIACDNAIRDGRLTRLPCEVCGSKAQAHHDDYSKPFDVRWLCSTHHAEWHKHNIPKCPDQSEAA